MGNWWEIFYVCFFIPGCGDIVFLFWFMGMQVIAGMIAGYQVGNRTSNLRPGWCLMAGAAIGFLMEALSLIVRTVALEGVPNRHLLSAYVEPTFNFVAPPLTALIVVVVTWLLCRRWPRLKAAWRATVRRPCEPG